MSDETKRLFTLLAGSAMALAVMGMLFTDYLHARRFVRYGIERQGTIVALDHVVGSRSREYVYSMRIGRTSMLKKFPYDWSLPLERSFLVVSDSPGPDDVALGNHASSALLVLCYMEGCDLPGTMLLDACGFVVCVIILPFCWIRFFRTGSIPQLRQNG
ncbi:MAG TPA: hypothetical protein VMF03_15000 [Steroidobacteraceae bacterium]|nr:hypothetical protein [Steroidobacteraceae bacterium]